ncbi:hypothetical protein [uncultured Roseobacter sp.]|uniref:hypothetical protein n=1 Tax=uncultured Roseobacter sp. TaxID=114847 RepID=UPI0026264504|nr:hypothetical protein [uncultured Roseobacter sp.]
MDDFDVIFQQATQSLDTEYFQLPIAEGTPVYRERVYCYELYHQMRSRWPLETEYRLNGEIDKRTHPVLADARGVGSIPDFLVHVPGDMDYNYAIIEVKRSEANRSEIRNDFIKLNSFLTRGRYQRAVFLIFGEGAASVAKSALSFLDTQPNSSSIEIWHHSEVGQPATRIHAA